MSTVATSAARPAVDLPEAAGEHVVLSTATRFAAGSPIPITGRFRIASSRLERLGTEPHRALASCVQIGLGGFTHLSLPFLSTALFPDDLHTAQGMAIGWFAFDAAAVHGVDLPGPWYLHCQLADVSSSTLQFSVA